MTCPTTRPRVNKSNNYGYDPEEQATRTFTGMGDDINVHDQWAVESMGAIQDRTQENLATTDVAIAAYRRMLREAAASMQNGPTCPAHDRIGNRALRRQSVTIDAIAPRDDWEGSWESRDRARRAQSAWGSRPGGLAAFI